MKPTALFSRLLSIVVLTLFAPQAAHGAGPILPVIEPRSELPKGFALDGITHEWTAKPTQLRLGPASQVAGKSKVKGERDLSARLWLALAPEGLVVAGEVRDDTVLFSTGAADLIASDHLEVWLAFPGITMPDLGFGSQWGWTDLPTQEACSEVEIGWEDEALERCRRWVEEQLENRRRYERLFIRQYLLTPDRVTEAYWEQALQALARDSWGAEVPTCCAGSVSRFVRTTEGYSFEALLPPESWPATHTLPLVEARFLVDLVDNDQGHTRQESFLSSSPERQFGNPESWNRLQLDPPLAPEQAPALATKLLAPPADGLFVWPARTIRHLYGLQNVFIGYQRQPEVGSPWLLKAKLPKAPAARLGEVEVYLSPARWSEAAAGRTYWLVSVRGGKILDHQALGGFCYDTAEEDSASSHPLGPGVSLFLEPLPNPTATTLHLVFGCTTTFHPLGSGMSGAAEELDLAAVRVATSGELTLLGEERLGSRFGNAEVGLRESPTGVELIWEDIDCDAETDGPPPCRVERVSWAELHRAPAAPGEEAVPVPRATAPPPR